jgi:hypothetical protein
VSWGTWQSVLAGLKIFPAAIFAAFVFVIHLSCLAFFAFSRGNLGFRRGVRRFRGLAQIFSFLSAPICVICG